jgi:hypothetical protein
MSAKLERDFQVGDQVECKPLVAGLPTTGKLLAIESGSTDQYVVQVRPTVLAIVHLEQLVHVAREREQNFKVMSAS